MHGTVEHLTTMDNQCLWRNCAKGEDDTRPKFQVDQVGDERQLAYRHWPPPTMQIWKVPSEIDKLDGSSKEEIPKLQNPGKKRCHKIGIKTNAPELGHGHQNHYLDLKSAPHADDAHFIFWWSPRPLRLQRCLGTPL